MHLTYPVLLSIILFATSGCRDLLEDRAPGWLGSSIYDNLKNDGQFNYTARLIEDLNYKNVLAKTGSKTLFVADDQAYDDFFKKNSWGVKKYEDLSESQKRLLLFGCMINNSYQLNTLSSSEGPTEGDCMRRMTALSIYDSVPVLDTTEMPHSKYWDRFRVTNRNKIVCMKDYTIPPMIHFIELQLDRNRITNDDYNFLLNHTTERKAGDASVNGIQVISDNVKCSNGFVHQMAQVMTPLSNMAEIIRTKQTTSSFSQLLERFCAPYYSEIATQDYNRLNGTTVDSVFQKRYFALRSQNGATLSISPDKKAVNGTLKFDPGWNTYFPNTSVSTASEKAMQQDMAVMLVPSDAAMETYWNVGNGRVLKDYYGTWDKVPDQVIAKLINNNMLNLFQSSVPSKFANILDDAINPLGITESDVDSVYLGCNGAIYLTNKVFSPTAYVSVAFPALVNPQMWIINWGIEQLKYDAYLNAMKARYSFFIPKNGAMLHYIDPVSYGKTSTQLFKFYYDMAEPNLTSKVKASVWNYDVLTHAEDSVRMATYDEIINRMEDILDSHTVIGDVESGNSFYRTKGGTTLQVANASAGPNGMTVAGSYQKDEDRGIAVSKVYTQGNGKTYILEDEPILSTRNTVYDILSAHPEFSKFLELLNGSGFLTNLQNNHSNPSLNIEFFSRFHYTVYVPTNDAITDLQTSGGLPTWDQVEAEQDTSIKAKKTEMICNFIKYHIQDNSVFVDKNPFSATYETAVMNNATKVFYTLSLNDGNNALTLTDKLGNVRHVTAEPTLHNLIAREYMYDSSDKRNASRIFSSANVVVHQIDGALMYDRNQFK
jgi:uncharacterized surface protein with fasciclin (FAS1) repeats